ncbi:LemA family protein [Aurantimonas aggregata]|uniref:LemA family protein n=1 Tax=Aurantimonas aggregata TaxID=2047720 RepID=A0A6L9MLI6_9HYPH|nr:LemA family protein [Aurantimonas aggregata]NDV88350.1 LemA family protein [Aurantimonas aggregata]
MQIADRARPSGARALLTGLALMLLVPLLSACGINAIPTYQEQARAAWAQVENQYQRRSDLIPNLVETVKGFAEQEREVLTAVVEARARATQTQINADQLTDPAAVQQFQAAQDELSGALSRLLVTVEAYPELRSNQNFLALQSQLEGTENRISVARRDYIEAVRVYNTELRTIPGRWIAAIFYSDAEPMQPFTATAGSETPPTVNFGN